MSLLQIKENDTVKMNEINLNFLTAEARRQEAIEFYKWPPELIDCLFKYSKEVADNAWFRFHPEAVDDYYKQIFYNIRQLSYSQQFSSMLPGQQSRNECDEIIKSKPCSCLEIGCGNGDLSIYLFKHGVKTIVTEHSGIPKQFLKWRFSKYNCNIQILDEKDELPESIDFIIINSVLDHLYENLSYTKKLCKIVRKRIYARPNIGPEYAIKRPETHDPEILKTVPDCFKLIEKRNEELKNG